MRPHGADGAIDLPGPWQHRLVAANGARFHVAEAAPEGAVDAPLVLLLHGFPEFWWAWRAQLPALAEAGYRAAAMDLRGYGGSDKPPRGYDPATLAQDVAGVVKALGERRAVVVGQGWGGYVGWATAALHPREVGALCAVSAPHPLTMLRALRRGNRGLALRHLIQMQVPMVPESRLADPDSGLLASYLDGWSAPGSVFPDDDTLDVYQSALRLWPAPHCALEYHRWLFRSRLRADGRQFNEQMRAPVVQPVCAVYGAEDPALQPGPDEHRTGRVDGPFEQHVIPGAGHFPHEEQPEAFTAVLLDWLRRSS